MEKTELMLEYERETRETLDMSILMEDASGSWYGFLDMMNEKAAAYDRLMSGGKKTLKEWANWLGMGVVVDYNGHGFASLQRLVIGDRVMPFDQPGKAWRLAERGDIMFIPQEFIDFNGDWTTSLTLPDGLEE